MLGTVDRSAARILCRQALVRRATAEVAPVAQPGAVPAEAEVVPVAQPVAVAAEAEVVLVAQPVVAAEAGPLAQPEVAAAEVEVPASQQEVVAAEAEVLASARVEAIPRASETVMRWETLMGLETAASRLPSCQQADSKVQPKV